MKKILLLITTFAMAACGSDYDDTELRGKISDLDSQLSTLEQQIERMQQTADKINDDIAALQRIANGIAITSVTPAADGGYTITFSDGQSYTIANGAKGDKGETGGPGAPGEKGDDAVSPMWRIDAEGYWQISFDGTNWEYPNNQKISALGQTGPDGATGPEGAQGVTPRLSVDAEGYWTVSYDGGATCERVKDAAGEDVKAVGNGNGAPSTGYDSVFASAKLSDDGSTLEVVLAGSTETLSIPVGGSALAQLMLDGAPVTEKQLFAYNETKVYELKASADYVKVLGRPDGWKVGCEAGKVSVTAPAEGTRATADSSTDVSLLAVLNNGLSCVVRMEVGIDGSAAPVARQLDAPVLTAGAATATSVTVNWTPDANASGYLYKVNGGNEQPLGKTSSVTVTELTAETAYTVAVKAAGDGTNYTDSEWASIEVRTAAAGTVNPEPAVETLTLDANAMSEAGLGLPTGKTGLVAGSPNSWSWEDIGFESYLALATSANAAAVKVPVLYFYKAATAGYTTLRNTTPLGEIVKITVNLIDNGLKKGGIFTMTANAGATETAVLSSNDNVKATEHVYTFPAGNNGMFLFKNASAEDGKVVSIVIEYKK